MTESLRTAIAATLARYDLLTHPFYTAWSRGELTHEQLHFYGEQYLAHVAAFPTCLTALHAHMPEGPARRAVLNNAFEEEADGRSHADLWRDFIAGMDTASQKKDCHSEVRAAAEESASSALPSITALVSTFRALAETAPPAEAIAAFYAYESQVPRIAAEKRRGLRDHYAADSKTCEYFRIHETADVHHAQVWMDLLDAEVASAADKSACEADILRGTELAAQALWSALDGIEAARLQIAA